jgi:hypothetical protein
MAGQLLKLNAIFSGRWRAKRARPAAVGDGGGRGLPFRAAARFASRRIAEPSGEAWGPGPCPGRGAGREPRLGAHTPAPPVLVLRVDKTGVPLSQPRRSVADARAAVARAASRAKGGPSGEKNVVRLTTDTPACVHLSPRSPRSLSRNASDINSPSISQTYHGTPSCLAMRTRPWKGNGRHASYLLNTGNPITPRSGNLRTAPRPNPAPRPPGPDPDPKIQSTRRPRRPEKDPQVPVPRSQDFGWTDGAPTATRPRTSTPSFGALSNPPARINDQ